jgi:hypothetical protein
VSFPISYDSLTRRREFIFGNSSSNDFRDYYVTQRTEDFNNLVMRQLSHSLTLYEHPRNCILPLPCEVLMSASLLRP